MNAATTPHGKYKVGHEMLDGEDAAMIVMGLENRVSITLEGTEIIRGTHQKLGQITVVTPAAGSSCLLYPFEAQSSF